MKVNFDKLPASAVVRLPVVMAITGLSRPTIWRRERERKFPAKVRLGPSMVGWRVGDLRDWLAGLEQRAA